MMRVSPGLGVAVLRIAEAVSLTGASALKASVSMTAIASADLSPRGAQPVIVERLWTGNAYRNYNYLIACPETGEALAIDPLDHGQCLAAAKEKRLAHHAAPEHPRAPRPHRRQRRSRGGHRRQGDCAPSRPGGKIAGMDRGVVAGDVIASARRWSSSALDTPGHTMCHICLRAHARGSRRRLFSGDTLFNAGAGNCHNGGDPALLYATFAEQLSTAARRHPRLPRPRLHREQPALHARRASRTNADAEALLPEVTDHDPAAARVMTLADEKRVNTFFRLTSPGVIAQLREAFPDLPEQPDAKTVFVKLRELRNKW
jgi:hydroxyacylglutathione hydrolase